MVTPRHIMLLKLYKLLILYPVSVTYLNCLVSGTVNVYNDMTIQYYYIPSTISHQTANKGLNSTQQLISIPHDS